MAIVGIGLKGQGADEDVRVTGFGKRGLGAKFIFFVILALAHAIDVGFVQTVDLVLIFALLFEYTPV